MTPESTPAQPEPKDGMPVALHLLTPQQLLPIWQERNGPGIPMGWANIYEFFVECVKRFTSPSPEPQPKAEKAERKWLDHKEGCPELVTKGAGCTCAATAQAPEHDGPAELLDALQDRPHKETGSTRGLSRSQKLRDAGFTARPSPYVCDECGTIFQSVALLQAHKCNSPHREGKPPELTEVEWQQYLQQRKDFERTHPERPTASTAEPLELTDQQILDCFWALEPMEAIRRGDNEAARLAAGRAIAREAVRAALTSQPSLPPTGD